MDCLITVAQRASIYIPKEPERKTNSHYYMSSSAMKRLNNDFVATVLSLLVGLYLVYVKLY